MLIIAACLAPLCWFGSPADFWFIAVGALVSTVVGCGIVLVKEGLDTQDPNSCYSTNGTILSPHRPQPESPLDFGKGSYQAFGLIQETFSNQPKN